MQATRHMTFILLVLGLPVLVSVHAVSAEKPKMATDIPPEITTPDKVETRLGTLKADASIGDVESATDYAHTGAFEPRNGRWGVIADNIVNLGRPSRSR